ncbi:MAG: hypothetical protein BGO68_04060 [Candidatus Amoebophilus sp. 36-38]|nr:MAG: hypothetical protein BGO68_04060 [Candidatus Amoebophilus sp. 36-38]
MNYFSIDYLIVYAFLVITLIIGFKAGKGIKDIREYAIGNKTYGTLTLLLTFLATNISGASLIDGAGGVFSHGIIRIIPEIGVMLQALFFAFFISRRVLQFDTSLTLGDVMGTLYGRTSKIIAGILGLFYSICIVSMQLVSLGIVVETLLGFKAILIIIITGSLLTLYSSHGGIKSVTITDVFQFLILIIVVPILANVVIKHVGGIKELFFRLPTASFKIFNHENFSYYFSLFLVWSIFPVGITSPPIFQRLLMAQNPQQLRNQYLIVSIFHPIFQLLIMLIGLAGLVLYPIIQANNVVPHIVQELLPIGGKGLAIAGLLALVMSTADSYLNAAGIVFSHDIFKPIFDRYGCEIDELKWAKYSTLGIGIASIIIALKSTSMLGLSFLAVKFTGPLLMFPLLAGILGLKPDKKIFYISSVVTLIIFICSSWLLPGSYNHLAVPISILVNGLTLVILHVIKNKGFAIINRSEKTERLWKPHRKAFLSTLKAILPTPKRIVAYSQEKVALYGAPYILFGIFCIINYTIPYFIWTETPPEHENLMIYLRVIGGIMCALLIVKEKWSPSLLPYFPVFWHLTVLYCLPFYNTVMFLVTNFNIEWLMGILGIIILLLVILDWATAIIIGILGVALGLIFYKLVAGSLIVPVSFDAKYLMVYEGLFGILIGLIFARRKQQRFDRLTTDNQTLIDTNQETKEALLEAFKEKVRLLQTLERAGIQDLAHAVNLVKELRSQEQQGFKETKAIHTTIQKLQDTLTPMAVTLERIENRATDYLRLDIKPIGIDILLEEVQTKVHNLDLRFKNNSQQQAIICDPKRIEKMLVNSINTFVTEAEESQPIYISLHDTQLTYPLPSVSKNKTYTKQVAAIAFTISKEASLPAIKTSYEAQMNGSSLPMPETSQELLLVTNQRIIKAHYGYTNVDIKNKKKKSFDTHLYILPIQLDEVRPRDMDDPYMELGAELIRANDAYPGASEQEEAFLASIKQKSKANIEAIKTALEMIKWYHGPKNRRSGEPFYLHPVAVAQIVLDYSQDEAAILGALLHDTVEDTPMLLENIETMFGPEVVRIVDGVTHFESTKDSFYKIKLSAHENILMLLETEEKRALYVKIADRMHNMRTIDGHRSYAKKKQIAEETLQFFVPLAKELGLNEAANELKERSMKVLNATPAPSANNKKEN